MEDDEVIRVPEVTPLQLVEWLQSQAGLILLDVREPYEFPRARFTDERVLHAPLSDLARKSLEGLPDKVRQEKAATVVVFCHHGIRSAQVTAWLVDQGWESVYNLAGGIDAYARQVDPSIGLY